MIITISQISDEYLDSYINKEEIIFAYQESFEEL